MIPKILISVTDVENIHESSIGKIFSIIGVSNREFTCNAGGYVFEVNLNMQYEETSYFATPILINKITSKF